MNKEETRAYQWIVWNKQEMCIPNFFMTEHYYETKKEVERHYRAPFYKVRSAYLPSRVVGNDAYDVLVIQRRLRDTPEEVA